MNNDANIVGEEEIADSTNDETNEVINEENMAEEPTDNADTPEIEDDNDK